MLVKVIYGCMNWYGHDMSNIIVIIFHLSCGFLFAWNIIHIECFRQNAIISKLLLLCHTADWWCYDGCHDIGHVCVLHRAHVYLTHQQGVLIQGDQLHARKIWQTNWRKSRNTRAVRSHWILGNCIKYIENKWWFATRRWLQGCSSGICNVDFLYCLHHSSPCLPCLQVNINSSHRKYA